MADKKEPTQKTATATGNGNARKILTLTPKWAEVIDIYIKQLETGTEPEKVKARRIVTQLASSADAFNAKLAAE